MAKLLRDSDCHAAQVSLRRPRLTIGITLLTLSSPLEVIAIAIQAAIVRLHLV
jgi:hypothetical protein